MGAARCSLVWIVISNWTRAEPLSSPAAAVNTSASVETHTATLHHFSPRRSTTCSPAWVQHNGPYLEPIPLLQRLKASRMRTAWQTLPCATSHTCSSAARGVYDSADQHTAYHRMLLQQHRPCLLLPSSNAPLLHSLLLLVYSHAQDRQTQLD